MTEKLGSIESIVLDERVVLFHTRIPIRKLFAVCVVVSLCGLAAVNFFRFDVDSFDLDTYRTEWRASLMLSCGLWVLSTVVVRLVLYFVPGICQLSDERRKEIREMWRLQSKLEQEVAEERRIADAEEAKRRRINAENHTRLMAEQAENQRRLAAEQAERQRRLAEDQEARRQQEEKEAAERAFWASPEGQKVRAAQMIAEIRLTEQAEALKMARQVADEEEARKEREFARLKEL